MWARKKTVVIGKKRLEKNHLKSSNTPLDAILTFTMKDGEDIFLLKRAKTELGGEEEGNHA